MPIVGGCVEIPDKPGLGVTLDYDQLERGKERFRNCPYRKRDDESRDAETHRPKLDPKTPALVNPILK